jgi:hypothetical protein
MPSESVSIALKSLGRDLDSKLPRFKTQDERTQRRGYFHAADDSQNAHSHWLDQVNANFTGIFFYSIREGDVQSDAVAFREHLRYALMSSLSRGGRVTAIFEQRNGFGSDAASAVVEEIYAGLDWSQFEIPQVCFHYPRVDVEIGEKSDAGLQAVDFMLWACLQKLTSPNSSKARWRERLEVRFTADAPDLGQVQKYGQLRGIRNTAEVALGGRGVYESDVIRQELENEPAVNVYERIETAVRRTVSGVSIEAIAHLRGFAEDAITRLDREVAPHNVAMVARAFLRLFEMVPLYRKPIEEAEFAKMYAAKKLAAVMVRDSENGDGKVLRTICQLRQQMTQPREG